MFSFLYAQTLAEKNSNPKNAWVRILSVKSVLNKSLSLFNNVTTHHGGNNSKQLTMFKLNYGFSACAVRIAFMPLNSRHFKLFCITF